MPARKSGPPAGVIETLAAAVKFKIAHTLKAEGSDDEKAEALEPLYAAQSYVKTLGDAVKTAKPEGGSARPAAPATSTSSRSRAAVAQS